MRSPDLLFPKYFNFITSKSIFLKNISWLYLDKILRLFLSFFISGYVARSLGVELFGVFQLSIAYVGIFVSISSPGLSQVSIKYLVDDQYDSKNYVGSAILVSIAFCTLLFILGCFISLSLFGSNSQLAILCTLQLMQLFVKWPLIFGYWFDSQIKSKYIVVCNTISYFLSICFQVLAIVFGANLLLLVLACLVEPIVFGFLICYFSYHQNFKILDLTFDYSTILKILKDAFPFLISSIAVSIYVRIDQVMLGTLIDDTSVGFYSIAAKLSETFVFFSTAIINTSFPVIAKLYLEVQQGLMKFFRKLPK